MMEIKIRVIKERIDYTGKEIRSNWALERFGVSGDSVVVFRGGMDVSEMVDIEDIINKKTIKGSDVLHFIVEHFDIQPPNLMVGYLRQRLLCSVVKELLERESDTGIDTGTERIERLGDDLFVGGRKLSVSIATVSPGSIKIHLGLNISTEGTPEDIDTSGLSDITRDDPLDFGRLVAEKYSKELADIYHDISKSRPI